MIAKELAKKLLENPDFEVKFSFLQEVNNGIEKRTFDNIEISDIGFSDEVIQLGGKENL